MAFSKAKITRFNDVKSCAPPPGSYNPKFDDVTSSTEKDEKLITSTSKSDSGFSLFRTPSLPPACRKKLNNMFVRSRSAHKIDSDKYGKDTKKTSAILEEKIKDMNLQIVNLQYVISTKETEYNLEMRKCQTEKERMLTERQQEMDEITRKYNEEIAEYKRHLAENNEKLDDIQRNVDELQTVKMALEQQLTETAIAHEQKTNAIESAHAREMDVLKAQIDTYEREIDSLKSVTATLQTVKTNLLDELDATRALVFQLKMKVNEAKTDAMRMREIGDAEAKERETLKEKYVEMEKLLFEKDSEMIALETRLKRAIDDYDADRECLNGQVLQLKRLNENLHEEKRTLSETIEQLNVEITGMKNRLEKIDDLNATIASHNEKYERLTRQYEDTKRLSVEIEAKYTNELKKQNEINETEITALNAQLKSALIQINGLIDAAKLHVEKTRAFEGKAQQLEEEKALLEHLLRDTEEKGQANVERIENDHRKHVDELQAKVDYYHKQLALEKRAFEVDLADKNVELDAFKGMRAKYEEELRVRNEQLTELTGKCERLDARLVETQTEMTTALTERKRYAIVLNETRAALDAVSKRLLDSDRTVMQLQANNNQLEQINRGLVNQLNVLQQQLNVSGVATDNQLNGVIQTILNVEAQLYEKVDLYTERISKCEEDKRKLALEMTQVRLDVAERDRMIDVLERCQVDMREENGVLVGENEQLKRRLLELERENEELRSTKAWQGIEREIEAEGLESLLMQMGIGEACSGKVKGDGKRKNLELVKANLRGENPSGTIQKDSPVTPKMSRHVKLLVENKENSPVLANIVSACNVLKERN